MDTFYQGKKVLITGHTGFKGSWLTKILINMGANVVGYALEPTTYPSLFDIYGLKNKMNSIIGDIRDINHLMNVFEKEKPEIVFHLAAQPIVIDSYNDPVYTYETNVMGTVNILECVRLCTCVKSFLNVTTDKVYKNNEWEWGYRENDELCGYDPYSNSKSCSELITYSYLNSFLEDGNVAISTARAGNVIGGGDFAPNRIIPDCIRAMEKNQKIIVRNPNSVRPYQHVLEPLFSYLMIAEEQYKDIKFAGNYNVGPDDCDCITTGELATIFCQKWKNGAEWDSIQKKGVHEANFLKLDCSRIKSIYEWKPTWHVEEAIQKSVEWAKAYLNKVDMNEIADEQIKEFMSSKDKKEKSAE